MHAQARACDLAVGGRQRVENLEGLYGNARGLVLAEPTAVRTRAQSVARSVKALSCGAG